jgi:hypothetical protein
MSDTGADKWGRILENISRKLGENANSAPRGDAPEVTVTVGEDGAPKAQANGGVEEHDGFDGLSARKVNGADDTAEPDQRPAPEPEPESEAAPSLTTAFELTVLAKAGGPLTKRISLNPDGSLSADGSACVMGHGKARRAHLTGLAAFAALINGLGQHEAVALGALHHELPEQVDITTKAQLQKLKDAPVDLVARTAAYIGSRRDLPALVLIDFDTKAMPSSVQACIDAAGGVWEMLVSLAPELATAGRVIRPSTSAGLSRSDTAEPLPGSQNKHIYLLAQDGADTERFLRALHARCWLAGCGWLMVSTSGQLLERSIIDRMVYAPEHLVFEGPPVVVPPVVQDHAARTPVVIEGEILDTTTACRPITVVEHAKLATLRAREEQRLAGEAKRVRDAYVAEHAAALVRRTGMPLQRATQIIISQCSGILLPDVVLPFDDPNLAATTVADVLANPARYEGETLADPLEGVAYGTGKAKILRHDDGTPWIHSFAHGRTVYALKFDAAAARKAIEAAAADDVVALWLRTLTVAALDAVAKAALRKRVAKRAGVGVRDLGKMEQDAREQQDAQRALEARRRRLAERSDPRPQIPVPRQDAEWTPVMANLNEVLAK